MNILLAIIGALLIAIAAIRGMLAHNASIERGEIPKHADRRIVKHGTYYWTEDYHAFPGWSFRDRFDSLEAAKANKAAWDKLHNAPPVVAEVVE